MIRWDKPYLKFPRGFGRLPTLTEVSLIFKCTGQRSEDGTTQGNGSQLPPGGVRIEVGLLLETFCPSHGFTKMVPNTSLQVIGKRFGNANQEPATITINGANIGRLIPNNKSRCETSMSLKGFRGWGAHGGPRQHGTTQPVYWTPSGGNAAGGVPVPGGGGLLKVEIQGAPDRVPASEPDMRVVLYDTAVLTAPMLTTSFRYLNWTSLMNSLFPFPDMIIVTRGNRPAQRPETIHRTSSVPGPWSDHSS